MSSDLFAVIDVETTGLAPTRDRVVEVACVLVDADRVVARWSSLVDPGIPIPSHATAIHGLTDADVRGAPDLRDALVMLQAHVYTRILAAHNAAFDFGFLPELRADRAICTMRLARFVAPDAPNHQNQTLRHYFQIDDKLGEDAPAHRALGDALVTAHILIACRERCGGPSARWHGALERAAVPMRAATNSGAP